MGIAMCGTTIVDQREYTEQCFIMTQRKIQHSVHIMENKEHYLASNLNAFIQPVNV